MEEWLVNYLNENNLTISTVESCTGGMIASTLVNVSGASNVFEEGYITYSAAAKEKIVFVQPETISKFNIVSTNVAKEMAEGGAKRSKADLVISVTGLAGPNGGTDEIPIGTVCIGCYYKGKIETKKFTFSGNRMKIRTDATKTALEFAKSVIEKYED